MTAAPAPAVESSTHATMESARAAMKSTHAAVETTMNRSANNH